MRSELRTALLYGIFATFWILFSDSILFLLVGNTLELSLLQILKGVLFVLLSAVLVYGLARREKQAQEKSDQQKLEIERRELNHEKRELEHIRDFRNWVEGATEHAVFSLNASGLVRTWNAGAARVHKLSSEQAVGQHVSWCFVIQDDWEPSVLLEVAQERGRASYTGWMTRQDESRYWGQFVLEATKLEDDTLSGFVAITRDLSDTRASERFSSVIDSIHEGLIVINRDWKFIFINSEGQRLLAREADSLVGRVLWEEFPNEFESEFWWACHDAMERNISSIVEDTISATNTILENRIYPSPDGIVIFYADVTQKRRVSEELRLNEERLRLALQAGHQGLYDVNLLTGQATINLEYATMLGYDSTEHDLGSTQTWLNRLHPDDRERIENIFLAYTTGKIPEYRVEFRQRTQDGSWKWILSTGKIIERDPQSGKPVRMLGTHIDIQSQKETEETLRSSQQRYKKLLESAPVGVFETDAKGNNLYVNDRWSEITGLEREQAAGQGWTSALHPDDREQVFAAWNQAVQDQIPYALEYRFQRPDGKITWVYGIAEALHDSDGKITGYLGSVVDLTARKTVELELQHTKERLQAIFDVSPTPIVVLNREGRVQEWNAAAETTFGWLASEVIGQILPTVPPGGNLAFAQNLEHLFDGKSIKGFEIQPQKRDGTTLDALLFTAAFQTQDTAAGLSVALYVDITEFKRSQARVERLNHMYTMLSETNAAIVRLKTPEELFARICQIVVHSGGFKTAFVGLIDQEARLIKPIVAQGIPLEILNQSEFSLDATLAQGQSTMAQAIRSNAIVVVNDAQNDPNLKPWIQQAKQISIKSVVSIPLRRGGQVIGAISLTSGQSNYIDSEITQLLEEMAEDVSFALDTFALEKRKQQTELVLQQSEQSFRLLFDDHPLPMWVFDRESQQFLEVNQAAVAKYGYSRQEFLNMSVAKIRPEASRVRMSEYFLNQKPSQLHFTDDWQHVLRDGRTIDVELASSYIEFAGHRAALVVATDITERKQAQLALESSRASLAEAQRIAHVGSWSRDLRTNEHTWSDEAYNIYGVPFGTVITPEIVRSYIDRENFPEIQKKIDDFVNLQRPKTPEFLELEQRFVRSDGVVRELFTRMIVQFEENVAARLFGMVLDVTERKQAQEALEKIRADLELAQSVAHVGSWNWNLQTQEILWSLETYRLFDIPMGTTITAAIFLAALHPDDQERVGLAAQESIEQAKPEDIEYRVVHSDGSLRVLYQQAVIEKNASEIPIRMFGTMLDITENKQAQLALEQIRMDLETAQSVAHIGSWKWNLQTLEVQASAELCQIFGLSVDTVLVSDDFFGKVHPDDLLRVQHEVWYSIEHDIPQDIEFRILLPDGLVRTVHQRGILQKDQQGILISMFGITHDITERKQAQLALEHSRENLNEAQRIAHIGSFTLSLDHKRGTWSDETYRIFGLESGARVTQEDYYQLVHPDDRARIRQYTKDLIANPESHKFECQIVRPDGSVRTIEHRSEVSRDATGQPLGLIGTILDITERKLAQVALEASEQKYRLISENAFELVVLSNFDGSKSYVSPSVSKLLGYQPEEFLQIKNRDWIHPEDYQAVTENHFRALHDGLETFTTESRVLHKDGHYIWLETVTQFISDPITGLFKEFQSSARDITERKQSQEALETSERLYRLITENAHDLIVLSNSDGSMSYISPSAKNIVGYDAEQLLSMSPLDYVHPDDLGRILSEHLHAIETGLDHFSTQFRAKHKNGNYIWLETSGRLIRDPLTGELLQVQSTGRDITERIYAQEALEQSREDLNEAQRIANVGSYSFDLQTLESQWSDETCRIFGVPIGAKIDQAFFMNAIFEDDQALIMDLLMQAIGDPTATQSNNVIYRIRRPDGSIRVVQQSSLLKKDQQGIPVRFIGTVLDITERQLAQDALEYSRELLNDAQSVAHVGSWSYDPTHETLEASDEAYRIFGEQPGDYLDWNVFFAVIHPEDSDRVQEALAAHRVNKQDLTIEFRLLRSDKTIRVVRSNSVAQTDDTGQLIRVLGTMLDITESKAAQEALEQLNAQLEQRVEDRTLRLREVNAELESFTSSVSHDLRSPLNAVQGFARALLEDYGESLPSMGQHFITRIIGASQRMDGLIADLLSYSRLSRTEIRLVPVSLENIWLDVLQELETEITQSNAQLSFDSAKLSVMAQHTVLRQIIANLARNAFKFVAPNQVPVVKIWAQAKDQSVQLFIQDNGIGMDSVNLERIFKPFERLHGVSEYPGTGIGLAFVKRGIERIGGQVGVKSELGQGSLFWLELSQHRGKL